MKLKQYLLPGLRYIVVAWMSAILIGCAGPRPMMPTMDLPPEPKKPAIHWVMLMHGDPPKPFVALTMPEGLALLEYLIRTEAAGQQYRNRIENMNKMLESK